MKILGKTGSGFILQASKGEVEDLLKATGVKEPDPDTNDTIPIANYIEAEEAARKVVKGYNFNKAGEYMDKVKSNFAKFEKVFKEVK